jgi:23S rRNA A2030 N6-methylase RlmJ
MTNRHFGRISEVWKHLVLAEVLATERPEAFFDTHAGDAVYPIVIDPERSYGVLSFNDIVDRHAPLRDSAYATVLSSLRSGSTLGAIPGGPLVAMDVLGSGAEYLFCDLDPDSTSNIGDAAAARDVRSARVLAADGLDTVHAALDDRDVANVAVFIDPFDHDAVGSSGLSAFDVAVDAASAGAMLVYWYGYSRVDQRGWLVDEFSARCPGMKWWCGDLMVSADQADMTTGDLGVASSPGTGSGLVCVNVSAATVERATMLGTALSGAYRDRPLPSGRVGALDFSAFGCS